MFTSEICVLIFLQIHTNLLEKATIFTESKIFWTKSRTASGFRLGFIGINNKIGRFLAAEYVLHHEMLVCRAETAFWPKEGFICNIDFDVRVCKIDQEITSCICVFCNLVLLDRLGYPVFFFIKFFVAQSPELYLRCYFSMHVFGKQFYEF